MNTVFLSTRLSAWLNLCRLANLPTAWSNILMAVFLAAFLNGRDTDLIDQILILGQPFLWLLLLASSCFYVAGMILNDVFDVEQDRQNRPDRPIPAGLISRRTAAIVGGSLLLIGFACGMTAAWLTHDELRALARSFVIVTCLPLAIVAYDGILKKTILAPAIMGLCRSLNILLGASCGTWASNGWAGFDWMVLFVATVIGIYVCGITWFARDEATENHRRSMIIGVVIILLGLLLMQWLPVFRTEGAGGIRQWGIHVFLMAATLLIIFRTGLAIQHAQPKYIQQAVVTCLFSLILFDALFTLIAIPKPPLAAIIVASMIMPASFLGKFLKPT